ncbi:hypothetical protein [Variovorax gossypii]
MIEIIDGTWAAGETKTFHINGEYLELLDALYQCDVYLMDKSGAQLSIMRKCEVSFFSKPTGGFNSLQIYSAQAQYIRFFVGSGDAGTRRISSTVQVVDGGLRRTLAGSAFMGAVYKAPVASQYSRVQLWNPAGSGKNLILKSTTAGSATAQALKGAFYNTAFGTLVATPSKLNGGAPGAAMFGTDAGAATLFPSMTAVSDYVFAAASLSSFRILQEPLLIGPGKGYVMETSTTNVDVLAVFEWTEEAI